MAEDIKSSLHDAVPSWNGFNYQGKIGLYVCLKNIIDQLKENGLTSKKFNDFIDSHSIEYEWIEDFSIKKNETYISLHQVKHKDGSDFSSHLSAVVTILNRKLCRLSETDFVKYIELNYDYSDCKTKKERNEKKYKIIKAKIEEVKSAGYLDEDLKLAKEWRKVDRDISGIESEDLINLFNDFEYFSNNTFKNSKIFFHTSEKVSFPNKELQNYSAIPVYHHETVEGLKTLSSLNIFMDFDDQDEYILSLSDSETSVKIDQIISEILSIKFPSENFSSDQIELYQSILLKEIDNHVVQRHENIRKKFNTGVGFLEKRAGINFKNFFMLLEEVIRKEDQQYWESFCMRIFEEAYIDEIRKLEHYIDINRDVEINERKKNKLERYRKEVFDESIKNYSSLLIRLSPHIKNTGTRDTFYSQISNQDAIKNTFLDFIQKIELDDNNFIIEINDNLTLHPSNITFVSISDYDWELNLEKCKHQIQENDCSHFMTITHLIAKTNSDQVITNEPVGLISVVEAIENDQTPRNKEIITNLDSVKFMSVNDALKVINYE